MPRILIPLVFVAAAIVSWLYWQQTRARPLVVSGFVEADQIRVGSRIGGRVADVLVSEGKRVRPGDPLLSIDSFDLHERLAEARARLAAYASEHARLAAGYRPEEVAQAQAKRDQAAATLDKLLAGPRKREIEIARERLNIAQANLELAQSDYDRVVRLRDEASAAKTEFDQAVRGLKRARAEVATAEQEIALLEEGSRVEDIAAARATLAEADQALKLMTEGFRKEDIAQAAAQVEAGKAQVAVIEAQMEELTVLAPCDCIVEAVDLRPGDLIGANAPSLTLIDVSRMWVRTYVPEAHLSRVHLGDRLQIRVDSYPDRWFAGRVVFIATDGEFTPRNIQTPEERSKQVFRLKIVLDEGIELLRVGMGADVQLEKPPDA